MTYPLYSVAVTFPVGLREGWLHVEIVEQAAAWAPSVFAGIRRKDDECEVLFDVPLSPAQIATLEALLAAHSPAAGPPTLSAIPLRATVTADTSTNSPTYVPLLTLTCACTGPTLLDLAACASASVSAPLTETQLALALDGTALTGAQYHATVADQAGSVTLSAGAVLGAGVHELALWWRVTGGATARVRPVTDPVAESATMTARGYPWEAV